MSDTIKTSQELHMGFERTDDSIQYVVIPDVSASISDSSVRSYMEYLTDNSILLDSKTEIPLSSTSVLTAYQENKTVKNLDLT